MDKNLASSKSKQLGSLNWLHISTLVAVATLVGTEFIGAGLALGWALSGLNGLDSTYSTILEAAFGALGLLSTVYFMKVAIKTESIVR